jgi:hypothetical protein
MMEKIKTVGAFVALFVCVFLLVGVSAVSAFSGAGSGTSGDPYQITTVSEMYEINNFYNETKYVKLMNDIDGSGFDWHPVGKTDARDGTDVQFDGNEHIISNITIDNDGLPTSSKSGIFAGIINPFYIHDVIFENITNSEDADIITNDVWGVVAGRAVYDIYRGASNYYFENVGIVGSTVDTSKARSASGEWTPQIGTFIGTTYNDPGDVDLMLNCFAVNTVLKANVTGSSNSFIGGIAGTTKSGHFDYSYTSIDFTGGHNGGFVGYSDATNPYYYVYDYFDNTDVVGIIYDTYYPEYGRNNTAMKIQATYTGFDFSNVWIMSNSGSLAQGMPVFRWATRYSTGVTPTPTPTPTPTITVIPTTTGTPSVTTIPTTTPTGTPTPTISLPTGSVRWLKSNGTVSATSANIGESLKITFDTLNTGQNGNSQTMDYFLLRTYKKDVQMNSWQFYEYIGYYGMPYGASAYLYKPWNNAWSPYNDLRIVGYNDYSYIPGESHYPTNVTSLRVELVGLNATTMDVFLLSSADISLVKNPLLVTNFADWIKSIGGEGLAYIVAVLIIIILASIPFLILHRMIMIIEIMMIVIGLGLTFMMGLISLWVVFGVGVGLIAIFVLTRGGNSQ